MRIIHIEDIFYPEAGYQVNILAKYEVLEGHEVYIITCPMEMWDEHRKQFWGAENISERDKKYEEESGAKVIRHPAYRKYSSRILYKKGFTKYICGLKPDIVFIHAESSFVSLEYLLRLKKLPFPIIMDSHTLEMASSNKHRLTFYKIYRRIFTPIIVKNNIYVIKVQDDDFLNRRLGIPEKLTPFISFGSDLTAFHPDLQIREKIRRKYKIDKNAFVIINTGKLTEAKGGKLLAESVQKKYQTNKEVVLLTVGTPTSDEYGNIVTQILNKSENKVIRIPTQKYYDLAQYYQASDLCIFARECSLSFYDAQACGLPVIVENNAVNSDRVKHQNGITFESGNLQDLIMKTEFFINMDCNEFNTYRMNSSKFIENAYNYKDISLQYTHLMNAAISQYGGNRE